MATGDLIKLGTLYLGETKQISPTKPWRIDIVPTGAPSAGDIPSYEAGQAISIRNTDVIEAYKMSWREVMLDGKKLYVSDRMVLVNVSHDELVGQGLVTGKHITIDGKLFNLRLMTGGTTIRSGTDSYSGGSPVNNEWDRIIVNEANLSGLPKPLASDLDTTQNEVDFNSEHNKFWNWYLAYSWMQETYTGSGIYRVIRGYTSARRFSNYSSPNRQGLYGWRPVLEVLHTEPDISVNINGAQRKAESIHVNINDAWRKVDSVYANVNGIWRKS